MHAQCTMAGLLTAGTLIHGGCAEPAHEHTHDDHEHELAEPMARMHYYSQKLGYSIQAENAELADFYLHELEELSLKVQREIPEYEGHAIDQLTADLLMPAIESHEEAIDAGDWDEIRHQYARLINSCNSCHQATEHAFIIITPAEGDPPFNQDFNWPG